MIRVTGASVLAAVRQSAQLIRTYQAPTLAVYNIPAKKVNVTYTNLTAVTRTKSQIKTTAYAIMAVVLGPNESPKIKSWGFTLDGHDFYVMRLGAKGKTLVYDLSTGQWSHWASFNRTSWRPFTGMNWTTSAGIAHQYGSNIIAGDDSSGVIWVLDPDATNDEVVGTGDPITFERVATAQVLASGRDRIPSNSVYVRATKQPGDVRLEYSDNLGEDYASAGDIQVTEYNQEIVWRSLGQVRAPGRLFRIVDTGALPRIDGLEINE